MGTPIEGHITLRFPIKVEAQGKEELTLDFNGARVRVRPGDAVEVSIKGVITGQFEP